MRFPAGPVWETLFVQSVPPAVSGAELGIVVAGVAMLSIPRATWRYFGLFLTLVHEAGHAAAALGVGQKVTGIELRFDHSGLTTSMGRGGWRAGWCTFWGYPVPAIVGTVMVWLALDGWAVPGLVGGTGLLLLTGLLVRNLQGAVIVLGLSAVAVALLWWGTPELLGHVVLIVGLALLVGALRDLAKVISVHTRRRRELHSSDAYLLARLSGIPSPVWLALFGIVIGLSVAVAADMLSSAL